MMADSGIKDTIKKKQFAAMKDVYRGKPTTSNLEFNQASLFNIELSDEKQKK